MGPGGEVAASLLLAAGKNVVVIERELIGGECGYWACIPSKTVLRPPEARTGAQRAAGISGGELDWAATSNYRDYMIRHLDDNAQVDGYIREGATVIKGEARVTGPGGGSAVEVETAIFLARCGVTVTIVNRGKLLFEQEEPRVGELAAEYLREAGTDIRTRCLRQARPPRR